MSADHSQGLGQQTQRFLLRKLDTIVIPKELKELLYPSQSPIYLMTAKGIGVAEYGLVDDNFDSKDWLAFINVS